MYATDSTGNSPTAVSPESMIALVPSRIAFATSDASARVGSGAWIIDSSICVAVITGFPRSSARRMIRFCSSGTSAAPISTPRSPRATMTASAVARISSSTATASAFSIFAITCAVEPDASISVFSACTSDAERTNESATKSQPSSSANWRSSMSFRVSDGIGSGDARQVDALVRGDGAADEHLAAGAARARPGRPAAAPRRRRSGRRSRAGAPSRAPPARSAGRRPARRPRPRSSPGRRARARPARPARRCGASGPAGRRSARRDGPSRPARRGSPPPAARDPRAFRARS